MPIVVLLSLLAIILTYLGSRLLNKTISFTLYSSVRLNAIIILIINLIFKSLENRQYCKQEALDYIFCGYILIEVSGFNSLYILGTANTYYVSLYTDFSNSLNYNTQISLLVLSKARSPIYYALLYVQLYQYNKSYNYNKYNAESKLALPTRLLYIGDPNLDILRLYYSKKYDRVKYIALSYCQGKLTNKNKC